MAMGWIGGVIAANYLCSQQTHKNVGHICYSDHPIQDAVETIKQMMDDEGCKTLQDKRHFLKKIECFDIDFGDKERNKNFRYAQQYLMRDIEFELQKEYEKEHYRENLFTL